MPIFTKEQEIEMAYAERTIKQRVIKEFAWQKMEAELKKNKPTQENRRKK